VSRRGSLLTISTSASLRMSGDRQMLRSPTPKLIVARLSLALASPGC
jgi:hypothetical protein